MNHVLVFAIAFLLSLAVHRIDAQNGAPVSIVVTAPVPPSQTVVNEQLKQRYLFTNSVLNDLGLKQQPQTVAVSSGVIVNSGAPFASSSNDVVLEGLHIQPARQNDERDAQILRQIQHQEAAAEGKQIPNTHVEVVGKVDNSAAAVANNQALLLALESGDLSLIQAARQPQQQQQKPSSITTIVGNQRPQLVVVSPQRTEQQNQAYLIHNIKPQQLRQQQPQKVIHMPAHVKAVGEVHSVQSGYRSSSFVASSTTDDILDLQRKRAREYDQQQSHPQNSILLIKSTTAVPPPGEVDYTTRAVPHNTNSQSLAYLILNGGSASSTKAPSTTSAASTEVSLDMLYLQEQRKRQGAQAQPLQDAVIVALPQATSTAAPVRQTTPERNDALLSFEAAALQRAIANQALDRRPLVASTTPRTTTLDLSAATVATVAVEDNSNSTKTTTTTAAPVANRQARIVLEAPALESADEAAQRIRGQRNEVFYRARTPPRQRNTAVPRA